MPCDAARFEQALREAEDGWAFGLCSYQVLHAPTFDIYADRATQLRIVQAIREYPARRAAQFQQFERPILEAAGWPPSILAEIAPRSDTPLTDRDFKWPVFLVAMDPDSGRYVLLGQVASMDIVLPALIRADVPIDEALAVLILCTCHGKPAEYTYKTLADGTEIPHFTYPKSAFTCPLHPNRFKEILPRLRERCVDDSVAEQKALLLRLLAKHLPRVVESLRLKPEPPGKSVHSVARSRLADAVSDELLGRARRARRGPGRDKWWELLDELPQRQLSAFFRSLTPAEGEELQAIRDGKRTSRNPNTARVLLHRACVKLRNLLREQHAVDAPSDA
ncbi:MAG: hypothetical protein AMS25_09080 [Gemmatimonas sp. SM23_52]|nr:MAG: hypothetical protein AMS25_09080 [Gemmatimonas sp. SM23_52]